MYSYGGLFKFNFGYFPNRGEAATSPPRVEIMGHGVGIYRSVVRFNFYLFLGEMTELLRSVSISKLRAMCDYYLARRHVTLPSGS